MLFMCATYTKLPSNIITTGDASIEIIQIPDRNIIFDHFIWVCIVPYTDKQSVDSSKYAVAYPIF